MSLKRVATLLIFCAFLAQATDAAASETEAPAWKVTSTLLPTNLTPGSSGRILVVAENVGAKVTTGPITLSETVPGGWQVVGPVGYGSSDHATAAPTCSSSAQIATCTTPGPVRPGYQLELSVVVTAPAVPQVAADSAAIEGGSAAPQSTSTALVSSAQVADFGFLSGPIGFDAPLTDPDGAPSTLAGSHPYQLTVDLGFPTKYSGEPGIPLAGAQAVHDAGVDLPAGMIIDPTATSVLCTEAQLTSGAGCPEPSQIGTAASLTVVAGPLAGTSRLFNMVPPPGAPAEFAFDALGIGIFVHVLGEVRSDGDYGLSGQATELPALPFHPVLGSRLDFWGEPSLKSHDGVRGQCAPPATSTKDCETPRTGADFLTLPGRCSSEPLTFTARAHSWEEPDNLKQATYESADLAGNPVSLSGCSQLQFEPQISAQPTTDLADSPSGLDFNLHQPQSPNASPRATAPLKDAVVTLPQGLSVNPSQADGLGACSATQIGLTSTATPIRFDKAPDTCPDAAKLGTVEVRTPLLAERDASGTKILRDPETGKVIPRPLQGSVYLAKPYENPFGSLLAIYLSIDDPESGTIAKFAGQVIPDPGSGQLTTRFEENPQLPLEDVELHLFGGARGALITPPNCATHTTTTELTPWSAPDSGPPARPSDSFQTSASPGGGACPPSPEAAANAPAFSAGTIAPQAGAYSPFVLKLSREDGSARLTGFDTTLPPGLTGKLAGIPACSDAALALAAARSNPNQGILERQSPSCPAASALGTVTVAAGAGPTPFHTQGTAYLAGPYKGAPLSMAVITPAIAGPFDLGVVLVRAALNLDPDTAQIHAVSDPFPTILHGIPLDLRSVAVKLDRPNFTLNPTSCDQMAITGTATSVFGQIAALTSPFQVGGCPDLGFKPKLSLALKGKTKRTSHPKLIANLTARPGDANIARAQVKLPGAAFLDQAHIGTVCTRVQFAARTCPAGSVYGKVSATTPLLDYTLTGNVFLRSSSHNLPDLVADLNGPASQPIEIALAGKTDAVKGALRNTFEAVPDQPVTRFHLELFGGKRGLIILSSGLCKSPRAQVKLDGQNGKVYDTEPVVKTSCKKGKQGGGKKKAHSQGRR